ncbi:SDR family oxidoreductase [Acerihabitans arboris]|uniref:SDR family oxidoreductase n=1 Tax=Acerihabitans arboris TaxID=2691583 RepID=A0A845SSJ1_9GAMM|nr:SDR family oxidoreductase [Acerihabitans arboris]NDL65894.1 SDR family oxidoreductase [Acerihabitans arboris]
MAGLFDLSGRTALVTGSARGLGFAYAKGLAGAGAAVILNGLHEETLAAAVDELSGQGFDVRGMTFDVTSEQQVAAVFAQLDDEGEHVDILINNAGIQHRQPLVDLKLADWRRVIDTNLTSAFIVSREVASRMIAKGTGGKIINICSLTSEAARATVAPYTAAKGGIKMLTRAMAAEWAGHNIQANGIGPGYFITEMNTDLVNNPEFDAWVKSSNPSRRWGKPQELIGTAVYLSSSASDYVSGQIIYVDGGWLSVL